MDINNIETIKKEEQEKSKKFKLKRWSWIKMTKIS